MKNTLFSTLFHYKTELNVTLTIKWTHTTTVDRFDSKFIILLLVLNVYNSTPETSNGAISLHLLICINQEPARGFA